MGVILPVAAVIIAGLLVAALWLWWGGGTPEQEDVAESHSSTEAMVTPLTDTSVASILPNEGFRVMLSSRTDKMVIQIGGTIYSRLAEISDATLRNEVKRQIEALQQFTSEDQPLRSSPTVAPTKVVPISPEKPVIQPQARWQIKSKQFCKNIS